MKMPRWSDAKGWIGGDSRTLYAFTDAAIGHTMVRPGGKTRVAECGQAVTVRVATKDEAERLWQSPLSPGWKTT